MLVLRSSGLFFFFLVAFRCLLSFVVVSFITYILHGLLFGSVYSFYLNTLVVMSRGILCYLCIGAAV